MATGYHQDEFVRRSQRVIRMVSELHRRGYQRLRIMPYMAPLAWRVAIAPASHFSVKNGAWIVNQDGAPCYTAAAGNLYFDWPDATKDNARQLADKFILRFACVCAAGAGRDWTYAGWLAELVGVLERDHRLPIVGTEDNITPPYDMRGLLFRDFTQGSQFWRTEIAFPLPPSGECPGNI